MLAVFVAALAVFHAILIWVRPLGRVGWKRLDYVWLLFGMIGVLSGVQAVRQGLAEGTLERLTSEADQTEAEATLGAVGPFLLAIALALRITKVTGELQLERRG